MKRFLLFFLLLSAFVSHGMAQNEAMYVWRNDGHLSIIEKTEIDSIVHSHYDAENKYNDDWSSVKVYTNDIVYTIPIDGIDRMEVREYNNMCPDSHHPHAIDLGLPSGTKWACCNVEAKTPEAYGGYYAWGETSEKSEYTWENYAYYNSSTDNCVNIGSDIAGTAYDVAHVRMGGSWRMPTLEQQQELINHCTRQWTTQNGINGTLVTGPNGSQLFLPAAGFRWCGVLGYAGEDGDYCSSSFNPSNGYGAFYLFFYSGGWNWGSSGRSDGFSVRAVCP